MRLLLDRHRTRERQSARKPLEAAEVGARGFRDPVPYEQLNSSLDACLAPILIESDRVVVLIGRAKSGCIEAVANVADCGDH